MKSLLEIVNQPFAHRLGWVLLHSLWQGALVAVLFGLLRFALRRASANARYLAGCFSLMLLVAAPAFTWLATAADPALEHPRSVTVAAAGVNVSAADDASAIRFGRRASQFIYQSAEFLERLTPWLVVAWLSGVALFSVRFVQACCRVRSLKTIGTEPMDSTWHELLADLKCRLQVSQPVRLLKSVMVEVPTVIGWLRPVILLPASSLAGLTPSQLEALIAHELAHVRRHDYLVNTLQNLVETLLFYHPAGWWISRCVREEREHCCDDLVVQVCGSRVAYARALATMEELRVPVPVPRLALAAGGGSLLQRIRRLLGLPTDAAHSAARPVAGLALLGIGLVLVIVGVGLMFLPVKYQSVCRIKIEPDDSAVAGAGRANFRLDPYFLQNEYEAVRSPIVLNAVMNTLKLPEAWGKRYTPGRRLAAGEALTLLKQRTSVQPVRNSSLLDIRASSDDPQEAAQIANEIAEEYRHQRIGRIVDLASAGIEAQEKRLHDEDRSVAAAQSLVDKLRTELKIEDFDPASTGPAPTLSAEAVRQAQSRLIVLNESMVHQESQLLSLQKLNLNKLRQSIQTVLDQPDPILGVLLSELDIAEQNLRHLSYQMSSNHQVVQSAEASLRDLNRKVDDKIEGILAGLQYRLDGTRVSIDTLKKNLESAREADLAMAEKSRPYFEAKRQLAEHLQFKTALGMKLAAAQTELILPRMSTVIITDHAVVPDQTTQPNRTIAAASVLLGLLMGILGLVTRKGGRGPTISLSPA